MISQKQCVNLIRNKMKNILKVLSDNPAVQSLSRKENHLGNLSLTEEALILACTYLKNKEPMLIVKNNEYNAQRLYERLNTLLDENVFLFAVEDSMRVEAIASSPEKKAKQIEVMASLLEHKNAICVTHTGAYMRYLPDPKLFDTHTLRLVKDDEFGYENLKNYLFTAGYERVTRVDQPLCYGARGGIIDVYSMNYDAPVRIEFFDNIIDSIRFFDIATQRTIKEIDDITIIPATDLLFNDQDLKNIFESCNSILKKCENDKNFETLNEIVNEDLDSISNHKKDAHLYRYLTYTENKYHIADYMQNPCVIISSEEEVNDSLKLIREETVMYLQELVQLGKALPTYTNFMDEHTMFDKKNLVNIHMFVDYKKPVSSQILSVNESPNGFEQAMKMIEHTAKTNKVLLCVSEHESKTIIHALNEDNITYKLINENDELENGIQIMIHSLVEGFECLLENVTVFSSKEIFNIKKISGKYNNKFKQAQTLDSYHDLNVGDYIVHNQHGVGKYLGIVNKEIDGIHKDFLRIVYKGDDELFVPLEQFKLIRKFLSKEGAVPRLNKLGSKEWEKTKQKISENVAQIAKRLVHLYSLREKDIGFKFSPDTSMQKAFEDDFEYELTDDQAKAVIEIKKDMESEKPMDRLLCGDVGFGKTEVAIRAAFKAVIDGKQVAYLCPTTILSKQHYKTFIHRMKEYAIRVEVLNRFISPGEVKRIIQETKEGKVDILIGTHRILSKDIEFKDLGFLIIDEEQRFGVEHKERIKELKNNIDVLSLSATPIPRTLQMSLVGIRSLSQLDTAPKNRFPVQTYVIEKNFSMIKEIIQRELVREGQVFYLYNNVKEIYNIAKKLQKALPEATIGVAHGKMSKEEIEEVMMKFTNNEYQILVCTTIIETGIDIPNANTILIEDADKFGLSQLYQIKGRVGRSDRIAYAYLMYSPNKQLSEIAGKRLKSIKEFTQLGSGYKIAMRDLMIRGAGDMLGPQQAGFIDTVGIDMYLEMLNDAISEETGVIKEVEKPLKTSNIKVDAYIPHHFEEADYEKIHMYQKIDAIKNKHELKHLMEETTDNYGKLPENVELLFEKKRLDILINEPCVDSFKELTRDVELSLTEEYSNNADGVKLFELITTISRDIKMSYTGKQIILRLPKVKNWLTIIIEVLERIQNI